VPILKVYFDGQSDMQVDFRLSRGSFNALMEAMGSNADHGWDPEIACLVFLFWLASGTSYRVVSRAFDMPRTSFHRPIHTTSAKIASLFAQTSQPSYRGRDGDCGRRICAHGRVGGLQQGGWEH
jgi:hypothetical protein